MTKGLLAKSNLANELCIRLTKSKLLIASPLSAGVNGIVKSLKCCRLSPSSRPSILLTIFSRATLAQALLVVWIGTISNEFLSGVRRTVEAMSRTDLICKPKPFWAARFLLLGIIFPPTKQENQTIDGLAMRPKVLRLVENGAPCSIFLTLRMPSSLHLMIQLLAL